MTRSRAVATVVALLCALAATFTAVGPAQAFNAPLVGYGAADGSLICDTVNEINPANSDVACASGSSGWIGASGNTVSFGLVTEIDPRDSGQGGPLTSMAYVVAIAVNGVQIATVGVNGKETGGADYIYAKCVGQVDNYDITVNAATAGGAFAVTPMAGTPYYRVDWDIPLASLTSCGITPTTPVQLYYGTSTAANLDIINKDYFRTGDSAVTFGGLATIQLGGSLAVTKTATPVSGPNPPAPGQTSTYDLAVTATDWSMYDLTGVQVVDTLPADVQLVSQTATVGTVSVSGQQVTWSGFGLGAGMNATLTMRVSITPTNAAVGSAVLLNAGATGTAMRGDGVAVNDTSNSVSTGVVSGPLLSLTKSASPTFVAAGGTVTYTLTLANSGNATASVTALVDSLPAGFSFVAGSTSGTLGAAAPTTSGSNVTWTGPWSLASGASRTLVFSAVSPTTGGAYTNTATVTASNAASATTGPTATVTVNSAPTATNDAASTARTTPVSVGVLANDSDPNGNTLSITAVGVPTAGTAVVDPSDATRIVYTPPAGFSGPATFSYTISDGFGGTDTATVTVTVANAAPVAVADSVTAAPTGATPVSVLANDTDADGDGLTVTGVGAATHGTTTVTGPSEVSYTPNAGYVGSDAFTYSISDGHGGTASGTVSVTVPNTPPTAVDDSAATQVATPVTISVLANDTDPNTAQTLSASAPTTPAHGTAVVNGDGTITYTPDAGYSGPDAFDYTVGDGVATDIGHVTITVTAGAPVAVDDSASTPTSTAVTITVLTNDVSPLPLTVTALTSPVVVPPVGPPSGVSAGTTTLNPDGTVTYTPTTGFTGTASFTYRVTDGTQTSSPATVTVTVFNAAPVAVADSFTGTRAAAQPIDVLGNDADANGDTLSISGVSGVSPGASVTVAPTGPGGRDQVLYTPASGFVGTDTFSYTASDGRGGTSTATVTVTVVDATPVAVDDSASPATAGPVTVDVLANDSDPDGDALTVTATTAPANGAVTINPDGSVTYTPATGFVGSDGFDYTVSDGHGKTDTGHVVVQVPNTAPTAVDDSAATFVGQPVTVDVVANDSDPNPLQTLTVTSVTAAAQGTAVADPAGTVTYTPAAGYRGPDGFDYTISDGAGGTDTAHVSITVANRAPVAADDSATTPADTAVTVAVLANDTDPDGDPRAVVAGSVTAPTATGGGSAGTALLNPNGTVTYTPTAGFLGAATFTYVVTDGDLTDSATVTVTVVDAPPVAVDDSATPATAGPVTIAVLANDSDPDGDILSVATTTAPANGAVTVNPNGSITYMPTAGFLGTDGFDYTVSDGHGLTDTGHVTVVVPNTAPTAVADSAATVVGQPVGVAVLGNDTDPNPLQTLTVTAVTTPAHGIASVGPAGAVTYAPAAGYRGADGFDYTVSDGAGGTDTAHVSISVADRAPVAVDDSATTASGDPVTVAVLANDTDLDGDLLAVVPGSVTVPSAAGGGSAGTAVLNPNGTVTFTPASGFSGTATFSYVGTDGTLTDAASVTVTVTPPPPAPPVTGPPTAPPVQGPPANHAPAYTDAPANTTQAVVAGAPLAPLAATDPDGDPLSYALVEGTLPPGVQLNSNGTFSGAATAAGDYPVVLRVCDNGTPAMCTSTALRIAVRGMGPQPAAPETPAPSPSPAPASPAPSPSPAGVGGIVVNAAPTVSLPRTGAPLGALVLIGLGTLVLGLAFRRAGSRAAHLTD
jgi:uncharacterized repeat protein (TIGR01451 family)